MSSTQRPRDSRHSAAARQLGRLRRTTVVTGLLLSGLLAAAPGRAQSLDATEEGYDRTPAFGRSVVSTDDTTAMVVNPATLAFLPGEELRWSSTYLSDDAEVPWKGHALAFGLPIPFLSLATGLRVDFVDPPGDEGLEPPSLSNYQWLTWGLAFGGSDAAALGVTVQRSYSDQALTRGLSSWSLGFVSRPSDVFGVGLVAHHINAPRNSNGGFVDRSFDLGMALRPLGTRTLEVGFEARYVDRGEGFWIPKGTLGIDVGPLGRLRGEFAVSDPRTSNVEEFDDIGAWWMASVGLAVYLNTPTGSLEFGGGTLVGSRLGSEARNEAHANLHTEVALKTWREPVGMDTPRYAYRVQLENTPGTREHVALLHRLWRLADEATVDAVLFDLRTEPSSSFAHAQELRDAIQHLRQNGKRVMCYLQDASGLSLYTCAAANRILVNPAGGLRFSGLHTKTFYYARLLDHLGIRADFVRIGPHKTAPEAFTRDSGSRAARQDKIDLLQQYERQVVEALAAGRGLSVAAVRERIAKGPFVASEAKRAGLVDGFAFQDQLEERVNELVGRDVVLIDEDGQRGPVAFGSSRRVAIVHADGNIVDGRSRVVPLVGLDLVGSYSMAETLKQVREDPRVAAVVLRIDSPGGSALAADVIWREVQLTSRIKPVIVSMGTVAASGGYYIATPASHVFANPLSITGSIGIYYGKADVTELLRKIGVSVEVYKTTPRADAESMFRPYSADEKRELRRKVRQFYDTFLSRVALGRRLTKKQVDAVGQGRVWTGEQAHERRLVDAIGGLRQAVEYARRVAGLPDYAPIVQLPPPQRTLVGQLLGIEGVRAAQPEQVLPAQILDLTKALAPFVVHDPDQPLALMEFSQTGF